MPAGDFLPLNRHGHCARRSSLEESLYRPEYSSHTTAQQQRRAQAEPSVCVCKAEILQMNLLNNEMTLSLPLHYIYFRTEVYSVIETLMITQRCLQWINTNRAASHTPDLDVLCVISHTCPELCRDVSRTRCSAHLCLYPRACSGGPPAPSSGRTRMRKHCKSSSSAQTPH